MSVIRDATNALKVRLQASFGTQLHGVLTFGPDWDPITETEMLRVVVDSKNTPEAKVQELPGKIHGIDVKVLRAGVAEM